MIGVLHETKLWKVIVFELGFLLAIGVYLYAGYIHGQWGYGLFAFLIPIGISLIFSEDSVFVINIHNRLEWLLTVIITVVYVSLGLLFSNTWAILWMLYFIVPVTSILHHAPRENHLVACMPFIATTIFFSLGMIFGWWAFSWLAFLLIPMVAILKHA